VTRDGGLPLGPPGGGVRRHLPPRRADSSAGGDLVVGDRALTATDGAAGPLADGVVVGRRFAVFAGE